MRKIKAKALSIEAFAPYGSYYDMINPKGSYFGTFYNDKVILPVSVNIPIAFSTLLAKKADKMVVSVVEYHNTTGEGILPLDGDVVIHVAPASKEPVPEQTEAFIVPKGTLVKLNTGVWHKAPMALTQEIVHIMVALPERVYKNDCTVIEYAEEDYIEIQL
jgi:ureidoglycolate lyase